MYCTGGIRCTKAAPYFLQHGGYENIQMLKGGIISYANFIRSRPDLPSLFIGKNFTFDHRRGERVTPDILTNCKDCGTLDDTLVNCSLAECDLFMVLCPKCQTSKYNPNYNDAKDIITNEGKVYARQKRWGWTCSPECESKLELKLQEQKNSEK